MARVPLTPCFAGFGPRILSFLLKSREQNEVPISLTRLYLYFVHLTFLLLRTSNFLFGPEYFLKQIDHHFKHAWFRSTNSGLIQLILPFPVFQLDSLTWTKAQIGFEFFGVLRCAPPISQLWYSLWISQVSRIHSLVLLKIILFGILRYFENLSIWCS
jgi:hypothetical protein